MFSDSAEETLTLTMGELQLQVPRTSVQPTLSPPTPPPPPQYSLKFSSTSSEQPDFPETGSDFYSSPFDNSFPYRGFLNNEQRFSCSSPTYNTSFLSETSFSTPSNLRNSNDSGITSESFGLLTTTSTPYRGNDANNLSSDFQRLSARGGGSAFNNGELPPPQQQGGSFLPSSYANQPLNDSGMSSSSFGNFNGMGFGQAKWDSPSKAATSTPNHSQFDFSFPVSEPSITGLVNSNNSSPCSSNGSNASADSPSRLLAAATAAGTNNIPCSIKNQWNSSDVSSLDSQCPESSSSNLITTSTLGTSIWSPATQVSAANGNNNAKNGNNNGNVGNNAVTKHSGDSLKWDGSLVGWTKQQLLQLVELLKEQLEESFRNGDDGRANQIQGAMVRVQNHIITTFVFDSSDSACSVSTPSTTIPSPSPFLRSPTEASMGRGGRFNRDDIESKDATYTWSGQLPPRIHKNPTYSCKVFLGGLPWDITEGTLMQTFRQFGILKIEWPGKEGVTTNKPKGYAYAVFESEKMVKALLQNCTHDFNHSRAGNYYYKISSKKYRGKDVQIIPWAHSDSCYNRGQASKIDPMKTIFVGAVHGMVNAEGLATIMNDLFGTVIYAAVDTDRLKYPIGSARVTFSSTRSYMKAIRAAFVYIKTSRFEKKLQVDPYLEDATCSVCKLQQGPYFCRDIACFCYFCRTCFHYKHSVGEFASHKPMMRTAHNKPQQQFHNGPFNNYSGNNNNGAVAIFNQNHHHQSSYSSYGGGPHHHQNQQNSYPAYGGGGGGVNYQHQNYNQNNSLHHGFSNGGGGGNNYRQWNNGNNERNSPQINCAGGGGGGGNGVFNKRSRFF